jgi:hypothetical protein
VPAKTRDSRANALYSSPESGQWAGALDGLSPHSTTTRCGSRTGSGASKTLYATLNAAVTAPIPSARVKTAADEKPGERVKLRTAIRKL